MWEDQEERVRGGKMKNDTVEFILQFYELFTYGGISKSCILYVVENTTLPSSTVSQLLRREDMLMRIDIF